MERLVLWLRHGHAVIGLNGPNSVSKQPFSNGVSRGIEPRAITSPIYGAAPPTLLLPLFFSSPHDRTVGVT